MVAEETWEKHRRRNDSHIVDTFQGQFRSKVTCPVCSKVMQLTDTHTWTVLPYNRLVFSTVHEGYWYGSVKLGQVMRRKVMSQDCWLLWVKAWSWLTDGSQSLSLSGTFLASTDWMFGCVCVYCAVRLCKLEWLWLWVWSDWRESLSRCRWLLIHSASFPFLFRRRNKQWRWYSCRRFHARSQ